jgi:hypothetical protein
MSLILLLSLNGANFKSVKFHLLVLENAVWVRTLFAKSLGVFQVPLIPSYSNLCFILRCFEYYCKLESLRFVKTLRLLSILFRPLT